MAQADQTDDGPTDEADQGGDKVKPWTIKGIPPEIRNAAIAAAKRDKVSIGDWVGRAVLETIKGDRNQQRAPTVVTPAVPSDPAADLNAIERMIALASQLATATGEPPPKTVSRTAYGLLNERLKAIRKGSGSGATEG